MSPHPPVIVPAVGHGREREARGTVDAVRELAAGAVASSPGSIVVISPHSPRRPGAFGIWSTQRLVGDFTRFGAPAANVDLPNDLELAAAISVEAEEVGLSIWRIAGDPSYGGGLDHGATVPLWFLAEAGWTGPTVVTGMNYPGEGGLERFGEAVRNAAAALGRKIAVIASGDMSHRLQRGAPGGYHPEAHLFDEAFIGILRERRFDAIGEIDPALVSVAGEDVVDSCRIALAACGRPGGEARVLSYEGPFGVGYGVAVFCCGAGSNPNNHANEDEGGSPYTDIARDTIAAALLGVKPEVHRPAPGSPLAAPAGAFVTLRRRDGSLRGCVGSVTPAADHLAAEIARSACLAAFSDRRFPEVTMTEFDELSIEVSVLEPPEPVTDTSDLDPAEFGVVVESDDRSRRGVMLPGVPGLKTVGDQLAATRKKAGIGADEDVLLKRFRVRKYREP